MSALGLVIGDASARDAELISELMLGEAWRLRNAASRAAPGKGDRFGQICLFHASSSLPEAGRPGRLLSTRVPVSSFYFADESFGASQLNCHRISPSLRRRYNAWWWSGHFQSSFDGGPILPPVLLTRIAAFGVQLAIDNYFSTRLDDGGVPSNHPEP